MTASVCRGVPLFQSLQLSGDLMVHDGITLVSSVLEEQIMKLIPIHYNVMGKK